MAEPFKQRWYKINLKLLLHKRDSSRYRDVGCLCFWRERRGLKTRLTPTSVVFRSLVSPEKLVEKPWGHLWTMELIIPYTLITWRSLPHTNLISAPSLVIIFILLFILALVHLFHWRRRCEICPRISGKGNWRYLSSREKDVRQKL